MGIAGRLGCDTLRREALVGAGKVKIILCLIHHGALGEAREERQGRSWRRLSSGSQGKADSHTAKVKVILEMLRCDVA